MKLLIPVMDVLVVFLVCFLGSLPRPYVGAILCSPTSMPENMTEFVCSSESLRDFPTGFPKRIRIISVEFTNISIVGPDAFQGLPHLQELHLSNNKLESLPGGLFRQLPQLTALDLTQNLLQDLPPEIFQNISALKQLSLKGNRLERLRPSWFHDLQSLQILDVSDNQLKEIPDSCFGQLGRLTDLDLSHNFLRTIAPPSFAGLTHLTGLNLEVNQLESIAGKTFQAVPGLKFLFLQNNSLDALPAKVFEPLKLLEMLDLSHNRLSVLEPPFSGQVTESVLDLSGNPWICDCRMLSLIDWAENKSISLFSKPGVICFAPKTLQGRVVTSLGRSEFGSC